MKLISNKWCGLLMIGAIVLFTSCDSEAPEVVEITDFTTYLGDWNGMERAIFKNDGETIERTPLAETLRFDVSGNYQKLDTLAVILEEGLFTITEVTNKEYDTGTATILQLVDVQEDIENLYTDINGENVFYSNSTFNVIEISSTTLVLSNARQRGRDFVTFTYTK